MPPYDFRTPRLFVDAPLVADGAVALDRMQTNYLCNVLRLPQDASVLVFNGRDGEWLGALDRSAKKSATLKLRERIREQTLPSDLHYLFAPLKHTRLDYVVQKAVELGVSRLQPTITRHTQATRVNLERMTANAIEAAEQCGILSIPQIVEPAPLDAAISSLDPDRILIFCDERADNADPVAALSALKRGTPLAVLIGPEGGFQRGRTCAAAQASRHRAACARSAHFTRRHRGRCRADTGAVGARRLARLAGFGARGAHNSDLILRSAEGASRRMGRPRPSRRIASQCSSG